ncbi:hypothetical protein HK104_002131 [Borealophlyctis nickersoniae]|nr:hypothetical protein HK104_002131 [Borealophlyctis nickersoniae]
MANAKTVTPEMKKRSEAFKAEGNSAFSLKQYTVALAKYTEAIALDPSNAVLYSNRSACYLHIKKWEQALQDATRAVELDPKFTKAMIRRATAMTNLQRVGEALIVYKEILKLDPDNKVAKDEMAKLKKQMKAVAEGNVSAAPKDHHPAEKLNKQYEGKPPPPPHSAASRLLLAYESFLEGMDFVNSLQQMGDPKENKWWAQTGGLQGLTNAVIRDSDALMIEHDTLKKVEMYMMWEMGVRQAINVVMTTPAKAIGEYEKRLKAKGWDDVRPALTLSIRALIFSGMLQEKIGSPGDAASLFRKAVQLLKLAKTHLLAIKPTSYEMCGMILKETFIRSVKLHLIQAILNGNARSRSSSVFDIEEAKALLEEVRQSLETTSPMEEPPLGSTEHCHFHLYHYALYHHNCGFYHAIKAQRGESVIKTSADGATKAVMLDPIEAKRAMTSYLSALTFFPSDHLAASTCCVKVIEMGCKIGAISKGQTWDLWAQSQKIVDACSWYGDFSKGFPENPAYKFVRSVIDKNGGRPSLAEREVRFPPMVDIVTKKKGNQKDVDAMMKEILKDHADVQATRIDLQAVFEEQKQRFSGFDATLVADLD